MPYADVDKQKEYQRKWSNKKNAEKTKVSPRTITWEELQDLRTTSRIETYKECILEAKKTLQNNHKERLRLALIAIRACTIRRGGKSKEPEPNSLKEFAREVGVHQKTLSDWTMVVRRVWMNLPKDAQLDFNMHCARMAMEKDGRDVTDDELVETYHLLQSKRELVMAYHFGRYLSACEKALTRPKTLGALTPKKRATCLATAKRIVNILN